MSQSTTRKLYLVLAAGCLIALLSFGARSSMGLFKGDVTTDFSFAPFVFPFAIAIQNFMWGAMQPIAGAFADRFGSWRVLAVGGIICCCGLYLMTVDGGPTVLYLGAGFLLGTGVAGTSFGLVMAAFARLVPPEQRSWAMGVATAAGSMGQFLVVPAAQTMIAEFGWISAIYILTLITATIVPLSLLLRDGKSFSSGPVSDLSMKQTFGQAIREAFSYPSYQMLVAGFFACGFLLAFVTVYLPQQVVEMGLRPGWGAIAIALVGLFNVVGAYMAGLWGSKYSKKNLLAWIYGLRIVGVLWLMFAVPISAIFLDPIAAVITAMGLPVIGLELNIIIFGAFMGLLWLSTVPLTNGIVGQVFGLQYMATLYGFVFFSHQIGSTVGLLLAGIVESTTGSVQLMWWACIAVNAFAVVVHLPIKETPHPRLATQQPDQ